jgi:hypothetical protein
MLFDKKPCSQIYEVTKSVIHFNARSDENVCAVLLRNQSKRNTPLTLKVIRMHMTPESQLLACAYTKAFIKKTI